MTNFNTTTRSFTLHQSGTESYAWAWENLDRADCVGDMKLVGKTPEQFARDWANTLLKASIDQINPEGERGFTAEEIKADLHDDVKYLANALQAWLEEGDEEPEPQPFGVETAVRLLEEGFIEEGAGIHIARAKGHSGHYDISKDSDDRAMYSVVWSHGIVASTQTMNQSDVFLLLTNEAQLGATFYWQTMPNNEWELTNAPVLPEDDQEPQGLLLCTSSVQGRGMTPASEIYVFSSIGDFRSQNPQWASIELPQPRWHGVTIIDTDLPVEGGYQAEWGGNPTRKSDGYTYYP